MVSAIGYQKLEKAITIIDKENNIVNFELLKNISSLDQVLVTGTTAPKRRTNSPVIVNLISSKTLDQVVTSNLSDGLKYQPGLRVETDCQACNYTQLSINGLQGE